MKRLEKIISTAAALAVCLVAQINAQSLSPSTKTHWDKGTLVVETPERPAGQEHVLGLTTPKLENVRVAFVGLGMRGPWAVNRFTNIPGVEIVALCDYDSTRAEASQKYLRNKGLKPADTYFGEDGYKAIMERPDVDLVYIATDWDHHFPVAKAALENGKHTAIEVPSAMNLDQIWELIDLSEKNRLHCMILENCCYDYYELNALEMAQAGVFGEILRAEGAYIHNLDDFWDAYWKNPENDPDGLGWRLKYNKENRGDLYATHGLGPVAQAMDIHRGDRFKTLVAMDTKSVRGKEHVEKKTGQACDDFRNGDHTTTLMRTENGKVVEIQHNVMTPQPYNRLYKLTGTKGYATKYPTPEIALDKEQLQASGVTPDLNNLSSHSFLPKPEYEALMTKYTHPIITKYGELGRELGHGGMDFMMDARLVYCLQNGLPLDMDVYDLAEWCSLGELGALSMDNNSAAVTFPDFTRGHWNEQQGYRHAYASPEDEQAAEAKAKAFTAAQVKATADNKLWDLYDAVKNAPNKKAKEKALKAYNKAVEKADKQIAQELKTK